MRGLMLASLATTASAGCAFGAVGVALYGGSPDALGAALLFAGFGLAAGAVCSVLDLAWRHLPASARAELPCHAVARAAGVDATGRPSQIGS